MGIRRRSVRRKCRYTNSIENLKTTAYIGGEEKEGVARKVAEVGGSAAGLSRDEVFINATDIVQEYPKKYRFTLVNRIQDKAVDIYECVLEANELDLRDAQEYRQRQKLQAKALTYCKELLFFIELSQEMGFISMSSCEYWSKLALEVKYMTTAWKKRDKTRA